MSVPGGIAPQRTALDALYAAHAAPGMPWALVDFPDHPNVGDSAIWLGELAMLRGATGREPCYVSTWHDFDAAALRAACPDGTLFLHGGGNLGDIWPHHQRFRERVLAEVRDRRVVQLPQSLHFRDPGRADRFATLAAGHPDFTLCLRDARSLAFARDRFACPALLAPDAAFALGPQPRGPAERDLLMLLRTDGEARDHRGPPPPDAIDWLADDPGLPGGHDASARERQAAARVARGLRLLSRGRSLVTDRLHGHILATLLGIPHVVLDNDYGKIAAYLDSWPHDPGQVRCAATLAEAAAMATPPAPRLIPA